MSHILDGIREVRRVVLINFDLDPDGESCRTEQTDKHDVMRLPEMKNVMDA